MYQTPVGSVHGGSFKKWKEQCSRIEREAGTLYRRELGDAREFVQNV